MSRAKMFTGPGTPSQHRPHTEETRKKIGEGNKAARTQKAPRFGPLTERELDIAEWTFRKIVRYIVQAHDMGTSAVVVAESLAANPALRADLREKLEAAS